MLSKSVLREVIRVAICAAALSAVMVLVFLALGYYDITVLCGAALGCGFTVLNFLLMGYSVERSVEKSGAAAKGYMGFSYFVRLGLTAAMVIWAIKAPYFNYIAAIIPLFFTRFIVTLLGIYDNKHAKGGNAV